MMIFGKYWRYYLLNLVMWLMGFGFEGGEFAELRFVPFDCYESDLKVLCGLFAGFDDCVIVICLKNSPLSFLCHDLLFIGH